MLNKKLYSDHYAYDISKNVLSKGEIHDKEVLTQSIEMILTTMFNERLFNPTFGSPLPSYLFDFIDENTGEQLLDTVIASINRWENRVLVLSQQATLEIQDDNHSIILNIPYIIRQNGVTTSFKKKINF